MKFTCNLPSGPDTPAWIALAEELGYHRAWCFDTPTVCSDVWMTLALAAQRTTRIGLGPGMLIPSLRHVATNAVAIATLEGLAPERVSVGVGTGTTARRLMGQPPIRWSELIDYVENLRELLRTGTCEVDGGQVVLCHPDSQRPAFPSLEVPIYVAAEGPLGMKKALSLGVAGVVSSHPVPPGIDEWLRVVFATVLDPGESPTSDRVVAAVGPGASLMYHMFYDLGIGVDKLPGGTAWREALEALPEEQRVRAHWQGHLVHLSDLDRAHIRFDEALKMFTVVGSPDEVAERTKAMAAEGVDEVLFTPAGNVPDELRRFAVANRIAEERELEHA